MSDDVEFGIVLGVKVRDDDVDVAICKVVRSLGFLKSEHPIIVLDAVGDDIRIRVPDYPDTSSEPDQSVAI